MPESRRVAIVGAGPSGFFAAEDLLKRGGYEVDLLDALPTPFGLVRFGVAPDHPKIKTVVARYARVAANPAFRFFGNVEVGGDVTVDELRERYDAVLFAHGAPHDRPLGIPGEQRPGAGGSAAFVAWYNGHPAHADAGFDLSARRAVVIGNGNVALDVARMLTLPAERLATTDVADHALAALADSAIEEVVVLGRRGPVQAAFSTPELRELGEIEGCDLEIDPADLDLDPASQRWLDEPGRVLAGQRIEALRELADRPRTGSGRRLRLRFLRSPLEIVGDGADGAVTGIRLAVNRIDEGPDGELRAVAGGETELLECGLVLRAAGYFGRPVPGLPFDERRGVVPHDAGRVVDGDGAPIAGTYVAGWIKRGPSGVIGTNKKCAAGTVASLVDDAEAGRLPASADDREQVADWIHSRVPGAVDWAGWEAIDAHERARGEAVGRPRVKLVRVDEMLAVAERAASVEGATAVA